VNRLSFNPTGIELRIVKMWGEKINELVETDYAIFCREWEEVQGSKKTAIFVRATSAHLLRMIGHWGSSKAHEARNIHRRRGGIDKSLEGFYTRLTRKLREDWQEKLDIEAQELAKQEAAQRHKGRQAADYLVSQHARVHTSLSSSVVPIAAQPQSVSKRKSFAGRIEFESFAGSRYAAELLKAPNHRVSKDTLLSIADELDASAFTPPLKYLERRDCGEIASHNQKFGSKALTSWHKLASHPNYQHAMRRRLAHASEKVRKRSSALLPATTF
jgi:hypothetical protein